MYPDPMNPDGTRPGKPITAYEPQVMETPTTPRIYHVWVNLAHSVSTATASIEYPGLVLGWRRGIEGYEAQVIWVTPRPDRDSDTSHLGWVAAHMLKPRD